MFKTILRKLYENPMFWGAIVMLLLLILFAVLPHISRAEWLNRNPDPEWVLVHESEDKKHVEKQIGPCYGWEVADSGMRICVLDSKRDKCKILIFAHEKWHEGPPMECPEKIKEATNFNGTE